MKTASGLLRNWLPIRWRQPLAEEDRLALTAMVFNTDAGRRWLNHQLDEVYCTVLENGSGDALLYLTEIIEHNAKRKLIHAILQDLRAAEVGVEKEPIVEEMRDARIN